MESREYNLPLITAIKLVLTENCQLKCKYCYESTDSHTNMPLDTAKKAIDLVLDNARKSNTLPSISLFGGEPLLVYDELMVPCIEYIRDTLKSRCSIGFTTNGILFDEERLQYLRSKNVDFMLSIDGDLVSHDTNRVYADGSGSFLDIVDKIPLILTYFPNTRARMTITPENLPHMYDSVKYLASCGFIDLHILPDLYTISRGREWTYTDFEILESQLQKIENYIIDEFESFEVPLVFRTLADMFPRIVLANHCKSVEHYRTATCCNPSCRCGIGVLSNAIIMTDGSIYSCQHGEISKDSVLYLGDIETGIIDENRFNLLNMNKLPLRSQALECRGCPLDYICTGGCVPNNYAITGDFTILPEAYCLWTQKLYESATRIIEYFDRKQDNTLFKDYFYGVVKRGVHCVC